MTAYEKVIVHWRDKRTGDTGHGKPLDRKIAEIYVKLGNDECPLVEHWIEAVETGE